MATKKYYIYGQSNDLWTLGNYPVMRSIKHDLHYGDYITYTQIVGK